MNPLRKRYIDKYGDEEPYITVKLQLAIITALLISISGIFIDEKLLLIQVAPLLILIHSLYQIKNRFEKEFSKYLLVFVPLYLLAVASFFLTENLSSLLTPSNLNTVLIAVIGLLVVFAVIRRVTRRKGLEAEVLMAGDGIAVVKTDFDLVTSVKPEKYVVQNKGAEKGDRVVVEVKKSLFGKPKPSEIKKVIQ